MALGDKKGALTGNANSITNPAVLSGSVAVAVGDLVFGVVGQQTNLTATTTISDNLGNSYSFQNAGTDAGVATGRPFWGRITAAGTLTTINVPATASTNDWAGRAVVIEGPFQVNPLDANPANITSDTTSPFTCPTTGTLAQTPEVVIGWGAADGSTTWAATSPNTLDGNTNNSTNIKVAIGYQLVTATTAVQPAFTAAANPGACVLGTASFKAVMAGTSAQSLKKVTQSGTGAETFTATSAQALKHVTQSATGAMQPSGTSAQVLPNMEQAGSGAERFTGTAAQTLGSIDQAGAGSERFTGTSAQALPGIEQAGVGDHQAGSTGDGAQTLPNIEQSANGAEIFTGAATSELPSIVQAGIGLMQPSGTGAAQLPSVEQSGSGAERFTATAAQTLASIDQAGSGAMQPSGAGAQILGNIEQAASGTHTENLTGTSAQALPSIEQSGAGTHTENLIGSGAQALGHIRQAGSGAEIFTGTGSSPLHAINQAGIGALAISGASGQTLAAIVQTANGSELIIGPAASVLARIRQSAIGNVTNPAQAPLAAVRVAITVARAMLSTQTGRATVEADTARTEIRFAHPSAIIETETGTAEVLIE